MKRLFIFLLLLLTPFVLIRGEVEEKDGSSSDAGFSAKDLDRLSINLAKYFKKQNPDYNYPSSYGVTTEDTTEYHNERAWQQVNDDIRERPENASSIIEQLGINPNTELPFSGTPFVIRMDVLGKTAIEVIRSYLNESSDEPNCPIEAMVSLLRKGGDPFAHSDFIYKFFVSHVPEPLTAYEVVEKEALRLKKHLDNDDERLETIKRAEYDSRYACAQSILKLFKNSRDEKHEHDKKHAGN